MFPRRAASAQSRGDSLPSKQSTIASPGVTQVLHFGDPATARASATQRSESPRSAAWRTYRHPETGARSVHPAIAAEVPAAVARFQSRQPSGTNRDHGVEDVLGFTNAAVSGLSAKIEAQRERHYVSHRKYPLGHVPAPSAPLPARVQVEKNRAFKGFGMPTDKSETAKSVLSAQAAQLLMEDDGSGASGPANQSGGWIDATRCVGCRLERKGRPSGVDLSAAGIDKTTHVFGLVPRGKDGSAADCMVTQDVSTHTTRLVPAVVDAAAAVSPHSLGRLGRTRGATTYVDPSVVCGMPSPPKRETVGLCMQQSGVELRKGDIIGKPVTRVGALLLQPPPLDNNGFAFGLPTVRRDALPPQNRRTDDNTNFGDEVGALSLIRDGAMIDAKSQFLRPLRKDELRQLLARCGSLYSSVLDDECQFEKVWKLAVQKTVADFAKLPVGAAAAFLNTAPPPARGMSRALEASVPRARSSSAAPTQASAATSERLGDRASIDAFRTVCEELKI